MNYAHHVAANHSIGYGVTEAAMQVVWHEWKDHIKYCV
jgi:hypothetical protein